MVPRALHVRRVLPRAARHRPALQHRGAFVALGLLVVIKVVAEQDLLPDGEIFRSIVATLLGFIVVESVARVVTLVRFYRRDAATAEVEDEVAE
ncbi:hypothetical protein [Demequina rhizosphaerae]|uniref:hypothetical protein n=1 Tax=Demequina rhizosphaerae TaxID=1638985 RepID=UPI00078234A0|nr:hypothetical protein [Demequina rhizosphaerae]